MAEVAGERAERSSHLAPGTRRPSRSSHLAPKAERPGHRPGRSPGYEHGRRRSFGAPRLPLALALTAALATPLLLAPSASAVPPDERLVVAPGSDRFLRARFVVTDVAVEPEGRVQVELLPTEEILLTVPKDAKEGEVLVLAVGVDRVRAFDLCISGSDAGTRSERCPRSGGLASATQACPGLKKGVEDGAPIYEATIATEACLTALRDALAHSDEDPGSLRFMLEEAPAQVFFDRVLKRIQADPKTRGLDAAYYGATLRLKGTVPREAVGRALIHAYRETVGRVSYDDRTERP